jgi:hypothetical protein
LAQSSLEGADFLEIREGVAKLCQQFPGEYWRELDRQIAYPTSPIPSFRRRQKPAEQPAADQHFREPLHQRHQPMVGRVRDQFVQYAALAE